MLDVVRFWLDLGLDGFRLDAVPYLFERDGTNGENLPETHEYLRRLRKEVDDEFPGRVLLAEANQWPSRRRRLLRRRRRVPHVLPLPAHAPHVHGGAAGAAPPDHRDPRPDAGDPRRLPVGHLPAQPRRADPRDGHRRGARLHVRRVRQGPADAAQRRHLAGGCSRCSTTTGASPSCSTPCCSRCRAARSCTTATRSAWATTSTSATATACARRCSGRPTATAGSRTRRLRPALPAAADGPGVRLPGRQRRGRSSATRSSFLHWLRRMLAGAQAAPGVRHRHLRGARTPTNPSVLAYLRRGPTTTATTTSCCASTTSAAFAQPCELMLGAARRQGARSS